MATRRVLRAVARNFAHSFLSLGSWFVENSWAVQHVLMAARQAGEPAVQIDLLRGEIAPPAVNSRELRKVLALVPMSFRDILERSGASVALVTSAELKVRFRFEEKRPGTPPGHSFGSSVIVPEMVAYDAVSTIIDDRGVAHEATVEEWWRT